MKKLFKYCQGDIVKILVGHPIYTHDREGLKMHDISPELVGKLAIVEYSYKERYGGTDEDSYSLKFVDTERSISWFRPFQMELVTPSKTHLRMKTLRTKDTKEWIILASNISEQYGLCEVPAMLSDSATFEGIHSLFPGINTDNMELVDITIIVKQDTNG